MFCVKKLRPVCKTFKGFFAWWPPQISLLCINTQMYYCKVFIVFFICSFYIKTSELWEKITLKCHNAKNLNGLTNRVHFIMHKIITYFLLIIKCSMTQTVCVYDCVSLIWLSDFLQFSLDKSVTPTVKLSFQKRNHMETCEGFFYSSIYSRIIWFFSKQTCSWGKKTQATLYDLWRFILKGHEQFKKTFCWQMTL